MHLVKIVAVEPAEEKSVKARHILKRAAEGDEEAKNAAREAILELRRRIRAGESFPEIAAAESDDVVSGAEGGDLGWFGPGGMVEAFEDAAFDARPGEVVGPVETQFGYHLIQVEDVSNQAVRVADMALRIRTTPATLTQIREDLDDLKYFAEEEGNFREEVERRSMSVETVEIEDDQQFIPDIGNSRTLQNFLESAGVGDISEPIELNDKFIIARLVETKRAGFRPFQEVRAELEPRVRTEARKDAQVAKLRAALQSVGRDLDAIALAVGTSVQTASDVALANPVVPGLGREAAFVGTAAGLSSGDVSGVVAGNTAAFVLRRTDTETETTLTDSQRAGIRQQLETQQRNQLRAQWIAELRESADIVDNRRFFLR
jgi:peptidylprolyl isomerase/peptidyl-prolyl cis-trans isomerase D